jgi:hypothetical protein
MRADLRKCRWLSAGERKNEGRKLDGVQWLPAAGWRAHASPMQEFERAVPEEVWRYLGVIQNGNRDVGAMAGDK